MSYSKNVDYHRLFIKQIAKEENVIKSLMIVIHYVFCVSPSAIVLNSDFSLLVLCIILDFFSILICY